MQIGVELQGESGFDKVMTSDVHLEANEVRL